MWTRTAGVRAKGITGRTCGHEACGPDRRRRPRFRITGSFPCGNSLPSRRPGAGIAGRFQPPLSSEPMTHPRLTVAVVSLATASLAVVAPLLRAADSPGGGAAVGAPGAGRGRGPSGLSVPATPRGAVSRDLLILGTRVHEGPGPSAPGHVRAYDVRTGAIRWTFHTIPQPGEYGHDTWPGDPA